MVRSVGMRFSCLLLMLAAWEPIVCGEESAAPGGAEPANSFRRGAWPFRPLVRPPVPEIANDGWSAGPVDRFVLARLRGAELSPSAAAEKAAILRRVTLDLVGLLPTPAEQAAFLADESPDAYERVVERLIASPRYGERWGQHWLDLVRYAESDGFKEDAIRPAAFRYRDYVIRAWNRDLPYDRFLGEQLAGDELWPGDLDALTATGLSRLPPDEFNASNLKQRRQEILDDITENTGLVFLGLTLGCAQCHDHKFDAITQRDYFRWQAFFAAVIRRDDTTAATPAEQTAYREKLAQWEEATRAIREEMDQLYPPKPNLGNFRKFDAETKGGITTDPANRTALQKQLVSLTEPQLKGKLLEDRDPKKLPAEKKARYEELVKQLATHDHLRPAPLPSIAAVSDAAAIAPPTHRLAVGNFRKPLEELSPGFPSFLGADQAEVVVPSASLATTGRRSALAKWLTRPDHPLTARVIVNRLWQHHLGEGLVGTPNDFGAMGDAVTNPELLDYLAAELISSGWSLKHVQRLIVGSNTYRQTSLVDVQSPAAAKAMQVDPNNKLLWRARRQRIEGEVIRDGLLQLGGELSLAMYGPSSQPKLPAGMNGGWKESPPSSTSRRSVYVLAKRNLRFPFLATFDGPDLHNSCPRRSTTITAPQALALLNGELPLEAARRWAGRLLCGGPSDAELIQTAYREAFGRAASGEEITAAEKFLTDQAERLAKAKPPAELLPLPAAKGATPARAAAVVDFCHALLNSSEWLYVD